MSIDWDTVIVSMLTMVGTITAAMLVYRGNDRAAARAARIQEKVAAGEHEIEQARLCLERLGRVEAELQTERTERMADRVRINDLQNDLRDERRVSCLAIDWMVGAVEQVARAEAHVSLPPVPLELRRRLSP